MNKRIITTVLLAFSLALLLGACRMPASRAPQAEPTTDELPFPDVPTDSPLVRDILSQTQTAIAASQGGAQVTPQPEGTDAQSGGGVGTPQAVVQATQAPSGNGSQSGGGSPEQPSQSYEIPPTPTTPSTYTLQKGEFPFCIARRYNLDPSALLAANNMNINTKVSIGTTLNLPQSGSWGANFGSRSLRAHPTTYSVQAGDTLNSVACLFGDVHPESIAAANGLSAGASLTPGSSINIP